MSGRPRYGRFRRHPRRTGRRKSTRHTTGPPVGRSNLGSRTSHRSKPFVRLVVTVVTPCPNTPSCISHYCTCTYQSSRRRGRCRPLLPVENNRTRQACQIQAARPCASPFANIQTRGAIPCAADIGKFYAISAAEVNQKSHDFPWKTAYNFLTYILPALGGRETFDQFKQAIELHDRLPLRTNPVPDSRQLCAMCGHPSQTQATCP